MTNFNDQGNPTPQPIADFGDWVRTADGTPATVTNAQPFWDATRKRGGHVFTLMLRGGHERTYHHYAGDDHLFNATLAGPARSEALFTVVNDD